MPFAAGGTDAATNAATDTRRQWVPAIPSFRPGRGPWLGSVKRPVTGRQRYAPPASGRRPPGAGWGHQAPHHPERRPEPSPGPRPHGGGQQWVNTRAPRARAGGRFR